MGTFLFDNIIFGPVNSRRLGVSLGVNLLPSDCKFCNFNCVYCECGWTKNRHVSPVNLPERETIKKQLQKRLKVMNENHEHLDVITFAGNGEPTIHPKFPEIIYDTLEARDVFFPKANIAVLSNATMLHDNKVVDALKLVEHNILKLDSAFPKTIQLLNQPLGTFNLDKLILNLQMFDNLTLQTLFVKGWVKDVYVDNSSPLEVDAWEKILLKIRPRQVMIYSIARDTPLENLEPIDKNRLNEIAEHLRDSGLDVTVSV